MLHRVRILVVAALAAVMCPWLSYWNGGYAPFPSSVLGLQACWYLIPLSSIQYRPRP